MILICGNSKGGVGKTTLAVNFAVGRARAHPHVLLIDSDEQASAMIFTELRAERLGSAGYTAVRLSGKGIRMQVRELKQKYRDIIIDVGGRDDVTFRAALTVADAVLIPVEPRALAVWAAPQVVELVKEAREVNEGLLAWSVLNAADPSGQDNRAAAERLRDLEGITYLDMPIIRRKAFPNAIVAGASVLEGDDAKAAAEFKRVLAFVYRRQHGG
jgi:chromosome partitioning protein